MGRCGQEPRTATGRSLLPPPQWAPQAGFGESRVDSPPETTLGDCPCFPRPCRETRANRRSLGLGPTEKAPGRLGAVRGAEAQPGPGRQGALVACRGQGPWEGTIRHAQVVGWNGVQTPHPLVHGLPFTCRACHRASHKVTCSRLCGSWRLPEARAPKQKPSPPKTAIKKGQKRAPTDKEAGEWPRVAPPAHAVPPRPTCVPRTCKQVRAALGGHSPPQGVQTCPSQVAPPTPCLPEAPTHSGPRECLAQEKGWGLVRAAAPSPLLLRAAPPPPPPTPRPAAHRIPDLQRTRLKSQLVGCPGTVGVRFAVFLPCRQEVNRHAALSPKAAGLIIPGPRGAGEAGGLSSRLCPHWLCDPGRSLSLSGPLLLLHRGGLGVGWAGGDARVRRGPHSLPTPQIRRALPPPSFIMTLGGSPLV